MNPFARFLRVGVFFAMGWLSVGDSFCQADCLWFRNSRDRQFGVVVGETETEIRLADRLEKENQVVQTIPKSEVLFLWKTIDVNRLELLTHRTPSECLHYALELLQYPDDPLARGLARHLLAVALEFGNATTAESAIRQIEAHPDFIADRESWRDLCDSKIALGASIPHKLSISESQRKDLQSLFRALRRQEWESAETLRDDLKTIIPELPGPIGWREFEQSLETKSVSDYLLARILRTELLLSADMSDQPRFPEKTWNDSAQEFFAGPMELPSVSKALGVDSDR